jgi:hypothetical protein
VKTAKQLSEEFTAPSLRDPKKAAEMSIELSEIRFPFLRREIPSNKTRQALGLVLVERLGAQATTDPALRIQRSSDREPVAQGLIREFSNLSRF